MAANNIYIQVDFNSANAQQNVNALNQSIAETGPTTEKSSKQATAGLNSIGISVQQVNREFAQFASALAGLGAGRALAWAVQLSADLSRAQLAMQSFTGSVEEANKVFEEVRSIAATSPFRFKDLEQTAQRLLGFGMAAKNVPDTLKVITDQVARMGGSIEGVNTIVNVFGRIMEKNFVGAMDLMRALPAQGVPAIKALADALSKELGHAVQTADVQEIIKSGILTPLQTIRVLVESMRQKGDATRFSDDAARAFKNLADTVDNLLGKLFGPEGFGPALRNLGTEIGNILAPLGGLIDYLMKLPPATKDVVIEVTAAAAAFAVFGTALSIVTSLTSPLFGLIGAIGKFTLSLAAMNPELAISVALLGGLAFAAYKLIPEVKGFVDSLIDPLIDKIKQALTSLGEQGRKFFADAFKGGTPIEPGGLIDTDAEFQKLQRELQRHANEAGRTLLEALASPVEAVKLKYATLFAELEEKLTKFKDEGQKKALRGILTGAQTADEAGAQFKENKKQADELTRYQVERAKGAADAQVAYIEAQDAQDLRRKVQAIDQITQIRMDAANQVAEIEKKNLQDQFEAFSKMATEHATEFAAAGINVEQMIQTHREELKHKQDAIDQKSFDDAQKYRLEGWKKANDAIIEDQKRVYEAFRDQFGQLFDALTDKTKSLGQALGDFFKKLVIGEAKELFASQLGAMATQAAGYGRPEETVTRGGSGILGTLLRRGMPPRPPLPPPEVQQLPLVQSGLTVASNRFEISTDAYADATIRFAEAVNDFTGATMSSTGSAARSADDGGTADAFRYASASTGVSQALLRAVAQTESNMNPAAIGRQTKYGRARGLMQLMPSVMQDWGVTDPFNAQQSALGGAMQLKRLMDRYGGDLPSVLAAYNMGPTAYDRARASGSPLPRETVDYVAKVMKQYNAEAGPEPVSFDQLTHLHMTQLPGALQPFTFDAGAGSVTGPSVQELASLPQQANALQRYAGLLGPLLGGAGVGGGGGGGLSLAGLTKLASGQGLHDLASVFGIGMAPAKAAFGQTPGFDSLGRMAAAGFGGTTLRSILTSRAAGSLAMLGGMALATKGLQQHYAPATVVGGGLAGAGAVLTNPSLLASTGGAGIGAGALAGAGLGLFASGFQRGGGAGVAMDIGGGAMAGAGIGFLAGGPLGAAIGAAIGAGVGALTGVVRLFVHTEQERIRTGIKQVYGIDISNRQILAQIQQIVDQKYGGSVTIGIRSQDVQDIVRLYALSTGQAANLPRPMYAATIAQSQAGGLATQPVYQGGVLVQNPYTGPTTYQYQTAVTSANGLIAGGGVPGAGNAVSSIFMQLNPQQANDLFTGRVVQAVQQNPSAVASANSRALRAGDSRVTQASHMLEPLTNLT